MANEGVDRVQIDSFTKMMACRPDVEEVYTGKRIRGDGVVNPHIHFVGEYGRAINSCPEIGIAGAAETPQEPRYDLSADCDYYTAHGNLLCKPTGSHIRGTYAYAYAYASERAYI